MPVLPDDGSRIVWPGWRRPSFSAASIIALAMRSFTDPNGFWLSSLAKMRTSGFGESCDTSTSGVWPMRSRTLSWTPAIVSMDALRLSVGRPANSGQPRWAWSTIVPAGRFPVAAWSPRSRHGDVLLDDLPLDDAVAAQQRIGLVAQADDGVVPGRIGRLCDVGRARVGRGVGVAVDHADDLPAAI